MKLPEHDFYFITDSQLTKNGVMEDVKAALAAGARVIQYREKNAPSRRMYETALHIKTLCRASGAVLIINDRLDIALAAGADGVHIGRKDLPGDAVRRIMPAGMLLGVSAATVEQARRAMDDGADYLGAGPVFHTTTKEDADPATGTGFITELRRMTDLPIVAIGGITTGNAAQVILAGADSVCAISATVGAEDVGAAIREFGRVVSRARTAIRAKQK